MQDTTKMNFTPDSLSSALGKDYKSLQRTINRLGISCAKQEVLSESALVLILEQESSPHPRKDERVVQSAEQLLKQYPNFSKASYKQPVLTMQVQESDNEAKQKEAQDAVLSPGQNGQTKKKTIDNDKPTNTADKGNQEPTTSTGDNKAKTRSDEPDTITPGGRRDKPTIQVWLRGAFVGGLIIIEAWIYASLCQEIFDKKFPFGLLMLAGVLVESAGIFIADGMQAGEERTVYKNGKPVTIRQNEEARRTWLIVFFIFQFGIVSSFVGLWGTTWSGRIAKVLIALSIPAAIGAYSHLFLTTKDN